MGMDDDGVRQQSCLPAPECDEMLNLGGDRQYSEGKLQARGDPREDDCSPPHPPRKTLPLALYDPQAVIGHGQDRISLRGRGPGRIVSSGAGRTPQRPDLGNPCLEVSGLGRPQGWERAWGGVRFKFPGETWLTVGISSVPQKEGSNLLNTLDFLFRASSKAEQKRFTVLIHLADSDLIWLRDTVDRISSLFSSQILAGQLLLLHAPSDVYSPVDDTGDNDYPGAFYSKQNVDYAFLMSYATNLSDYFLLLEDNVFCSPNFVSQIRGKVTDMNFHQWALMEFSNMGLLGKLFHSKDLPLLTQFILLFYKEKPLDKLIPHFRALLLQEKPILYRPFLFFHRAPYPNLVNSQTSGVEKKDVHGPDNPPASVFTDMTIFDVHFPWEAYTLAESYFWTHNVSAGNHLTVLFNHPVNVRRVQVRTGSMMEGEYALKKAQVELGYNPERVPQHCTDFILLGHLFEGQMDQEVFPKDIRHNVSCLRLVVKASQVGGLMIRHIFLWEEKGKEKAAATS
ncbi:alpha-1,3-mannosyl-glycoprotein 4-beta-N-acetylglucosaminyltransferase-like protein MGAT4E [Rhynchocyon petersi]